MDFLHNIGGFGGWENQLPSSFCFDQFKFNDKTASKENIREWPTNKKIDKSNKLNEQAIIRSWQHNEQLNVFWEKKKEIN